MVNPSRKFARVYGLGPLEMGSTMNKIIRIGTLGLAGSVGIGALAVGGYGLAANAGDDAFKKREDNGLS